MNERSDVELIAAAQTGDRLAWELLVRKHAVRIAAYLGARIRRPDVVDRLVGDTIYAAWRHLGELDEPATFASWLRRLAANQALRWHKAHKDESLTAPLPAERCGEADEQDELRRLDAALGALPEPQRMALEQRYRGGIDGADLAEGLHQPDAKAAAELVEQSLASLAAIYKAS